MISTQERSKKELSEKGLESSLELFKEGPVHDELIEKRQTVQAELKVINERIAALTPHQTQQSQVR